MISLRLALRAVLAFLAMPGIVAFAIPLLWLKPQASWRDFAPPAVVVLLAGCAILGWCVWAFYAQGRGTLAPWDPPTGLVRNGLYHFSRNPMYVGVLLIIAGWAIGFRSWPLALYGAILGLAFHLRILFYEEPWLARTFGTEWNAYRERVPRWLS